MANYSSVYIPAATWACEPSLIGPFASGTPGATGSCASFAVTDTIDDSVAATGGNLWDTATDLNSPNVFEPTDAVVVQPGASTTLRVSITPSADDAGTTVRGYLAVQSLNVAVFGGLQSLSGDDLVHIPYAYSVTDAG